MGIKNSSENKDPQKQSEEEQEEEQENKKPGLWQEMKDAYKESREEQKRKEAARNPSTFTRATMATLVIFNAIIAVLLAMTIIGIPIAALLIWCDIYLWMKYVTKKPKPMPGKSENETKEKNEEQSQYTDKYEQLENIAELKERGILSEEEFQEEKKKLLG